MTTTYRHGRYRAWRAGRKMRWAVRTLAGWPPLRRMTFRLDRLKMRNLDAIGRLHGVDPFARATIVAGRIKRDRAED